MSFAAIVNAILNALKLSWPILIAVLVFSSIVVFMPNAWAAYFNVTDLIGHLRPYCFFVAILCMCLLIAPLANLAGSVLKEKLNTRNLYKRLQMLSEEEKAVLRGYIENNTKTQRFPMADGVIGGLEGWGIVYRSANISQGMNAVFPYNLQPWAWSYLKKHPEAVREAKDNP